MSIEYPIEVSGIKFDGEAIPLRGGISARIGSFVKIRPCAEEYGDKTYLGLYLGDMTVSHSVFYDKESKELTFSNGMSNPAIFVFDLNKTIFGFESWWGLIKSEEELQEITDGDIENVWYVKALKQLAEMTEQDDETV